ncbi:MAG: bis(5'-nucleosyl)-tetraphosphatase (symmetrical) YqeK [Clostridia bacterium]|nr:bis(5'-nucleosyl)-tetraphosphatase (symmetrical) YqeK [Clostridia bacterium]
MQKLGVLGGTFDPIHAGHIALAREALSFGALDGVIILPMARPAHREADAKAADRLTMCRLAVEDEKDLLLSQAGMAAGVKYTWDTIAPLRREFPKAEFVFLIGADKLVSLPYWYQADKLFAQCGFLCFSRSGVNTGEALEKVRQAGARVEMMPEFRTPYSASMIRAQTAQYQDAPGLNPKVLNFMAQRGLYQPDFVPKLKTMMNPHRFQHTLGVRKEAVRLAGIHGLPVQKAALAGLLHDCAKGMSLKDMARLAREEHLDVNETTLASGALLHAPVGAFLAKKEFGIHDEDVLNAIRSHTVGRVGMSRLEMCVFVADATEETREEYKGLPELRRLAELSLPAAVYRSFQLTQEYLMETNRAFDPSSLKTMAFVKGLMTPAEKRLIALKEEEGGI